MSLTNPAADLLNDYPFQRLRDLLDPLPAAEGLKPLALTIGEPQHAAPEMISKVLADQKDLWTKYPPIGGTPDFQQAVADWLSARFSLPSGLVDGARHTLPAAGTREALFLAGTLSVPEKKNGKTPKVLLPNPFYQAYVGAAILNRAEPVFLPCTKETGFQPDLDALDDDTLNSTALMFLCSPGNPQGAMASLDYLKKAIKLARDRGFVLVVDECYSEIFNHTPPPGALQACHELGGGFDNVLVCHSLSKRSNAAGLRSGFIAGDEKLIKTFNRIRSYAAPTVPIPVQAASAALWRDEAHVVENRRLYQEKFKLADDIIGNRLGHYTPDGGFFLWLDVGDSEEAAKALWQKAALRVLPGLYLARDDGAGNPGQPYIRAALVHDIDTTREALERLVGVLG